MPRDLSSLPDRYPFLFERFAASQVQELLDRLAVDPGDVEEELRRLTADTSPRECPESLIHHDVISVYQQAIEACANKKPEDLEEIRDEADWRASRMLDGASHGATLGEQRASMVFRHPDVHPELPGFGHGGEEGRSFDVRRMRLANRLRFTEATRAVREYEDLHAELRGVLSSKAQRAQRAGTLLPEIRARFPELAERLRVPADLFDLSPSEGALLVLAARHGGHVGPKAVLQHLNEARRAVAAWRRWGAVNHLGRTHTP